MEPPPKPGRISDSGFAYDTFGRITTVPATAAGTPADVTAGYYTSDMVRALTQAGTTHTWTLDPNQRPRARTDTGGTSGTRTNHYNNDGDSPSWIAEDPTGTHWTRNISALGSDLAAIQDSTTATTLQLANLHGDTIATASPDPTTTSLLSTFEATEFGTPRTGTSPRYGWLGAKQRETDDLTGIMLMGVRLYVPTVGRFLQVDPVEGGSSNDYDYAGQDPINAYDLDGRCWRAWHCWRHRIGLVGYQGLRAAAFVSYGVYYGSYRANKWIARHRRYVPLHALRPAFWGGQAFGIAGDAGIDFIKRHTCCHHESIWDEHTYGSINPFHKRNAKRTTFLPGLYRRRNRPRVDWAW